ncbi:unnamed protein product [Didymodactylos carnosus]|uniref:Uncharacterized protein n=1 Tax=Didymodactylos carnosus TaxID=1234261 RepID=A0A816CDG0_9BILA|nr:unnamed protein product [Didymodactylos carnosus]CAF4507409.1 unnamed protein product [Didymodactylos carnosus]
MSANQESTSTTSGHSSNPHVSHQPGEKPAESLKPAGGVSTEGNRELTGGTTLHGKDSTKGHHQQGEKSAESLKPAGGVSTEGNRESTGGAVHGKDSSTGHHQQTGVHGRTVYTHAAEGGSHHDVKDNDHKHDDKNKK